MTPKKINKKWRPTGFPSLIHLAKRINSCYGVSASERIKCT